MAPKDKGGLGIGSLMAQNLALLFKWWWKLYDGRPAVWKMVIHAIHNSNNKPFHALASKSVSGVWNNIIKLKSDLDSMGLQLFDSVSLKIGNGKKFLFWLDQWIGETPLQVRFPALYSLESRKSCRVNERIGPNGYIWEWKHAFNNQCYVIELCDMLHLISSTQLNQSEDTLGCKISSDTTFSVQTIRCWIDGKLTTTGYTNTVWNKIAPMKVNCFIWRVGLGRIPVAKCLRDRGVLSISSVCKVCDRDDECIDHAFVSCPRSLEIRWWIFNWCGLALPNFSTVLDLNWGNCPKKRKVLLTIIYCVIWHTWRARNDMVFNKHHKNYATVAGDIITMAFTWIKHRSKFHCNWIDWSICPFSSIS